MGYAVFWFPSDAFISCFLDFEVGSKQIYLPFPDIYLAVSVTLPQRNVLKQKQVYDVVL